MIDETEKKLGRIDILVNNAGTTAFVPFNDLEGMTEDDWEDPGSLTSTSRASGSARRRQPRRCDGRRSGAIVNITSVSGIRPVGSSIGYSVLESGCHPPEPKCLSLALAPEIRVNSGGARLGADALVGPRRRGSSGRRCVPGDQKPGARSRPRRSRRPRSS